MFIFNPMKQSWNVHYLNLFTRLSMFFSLCLMIDKLLIRKAYMYIVHANNYCFSDATFRIDYCDCFTRYMEAFRSIAYLRLGFIQFCLEKQTQILSLEINFSIFCRMLYLHRSYTVTLWPWYVNTLVSLYAFIIVMS